METQSRTTSYVSEVLDLNREYIDAVKRSDVWWFNEKLTDDFRCSLPDGTIFDPRAIPRARGAAPRRLAARGP